MKILSNKSRNDFSWATWGQKLAWRFGMLSLFLALLRRHVVSRTLVIISKGCDGNLNLGGPVCMKNESRRPGNQQMCTIQFLYLVNCPCDANKWQVSTIYDFSFLIKRFGSWGFLQRSKYFCDGHYLIFSLQRLNL